MAFDFINQAVLSVDYISAVAMGKVPGVSILRKFGRNPAAGTIQVPIWGGGNATYNWPTAVQGMRMACTNNAATNAMVLEFLDANYATQQVTATLTGTTPVNLGTYLHFNRGWNNEPGRIIGKLAGSVSVFGSGASGAGTAVNTDMLLGIINDRFEQTEQAIFTVPDNQNLLIFEIWGGIDESSGVSAVAADYSLFRGAPGYPMRDEQTRGQTNLGANPMSDLSRFPLNVGSRSSVELRVQCDATGLEIGGGFRGLLVDL